VKQALEKPAKLAALGVPADSEFFNASYLMTQTDRLAISMCANGCKDKFVGANTAATLYAPALLANGMIKACNCGGTHPVHGE